jgi:DNA-binding MarR family transcriptional regulator
VSDENYANQAQQRVLRTLVVLLERGSVGALPGEIAERIGTIPSNTTRDLANLRLAGLATSVNGRWFHSEPNPASTVDD